MSRICAETGLFFIQPYWQLTAVFLGLLGSVALGPRSISVVVLISLIFTIDPREAMMPFFVNGLRIAQNSHLRRGRLTVLMGVTFLVCLLGGVTVVLWLQYSRGAGLTDTWATKNVPTMGFDLLDKEIQAMKAEGTFEQARGMTARQRLGAIRLNKDFATFALVGCLLFVGGAFLRARFSKWPFHPIIFLVWLTYPASQFWASFLLGWAVKGLIVRFGGGKVYQKMKPFMVGIIAGELIVGLLFMIFGALYYARTGFAPSKFSVFPG
jgi:hypothetical protein